ncbi:MAG: T9SS type A sorting domain-containing protein, partial [Psychroserpens sp.]|nr:T9SS type A sorting domain-containing protein [Psychroserpens sp.]
NSWQAKGSDLQGDSGFQRFGWAIDLSANGEILAVGAPQGNNASFFRFGIDDWEMVGSPILGEGINNEFGFSIALDIGGEITIIGDPDNDEVAISSGSVQVYSLYEILSIDEIPGNQFTVFPNPTNSLLNVSGNSQIQIVEVYDVNGRILRRIAPENSGHSVSVDVSELNSGIYFLSVKSVEKSKVIRFIKH